MSDNQKKRKNYYILIWLLLIPFQIIDIISFLIGLKTNGLNFILDILSIIIIILFVFSILISSDHDLYKSELYILQTPIYCAFMDKLEDSNIEYYSDLECLGRERNKKELDNLREKEKQSIAEELFDEDDFLDENQYQRFTDEELWLKGMMFKYYSDKNIFFTIKEAENYGKANSHHFKEYIITPVKTIGELKNIITYHRRYNKVPPPTKKHKTRREIYDEEITANPISEVRRFDCVGECDFSNTIALALTRDEGNEYKQILVKELKGCVIKTENTNGVELEGCPTQTKIELFDIFCHHCYGKIAEIIEDFFKAI